MILKVGGETVVCRPGVVAEFAGDIPTTAKLVDGPIVDLNLMTMRGKASGKMTFVDRSGELAKCEMLVAVSQTAEITVDNESFILHHQDAFLDASNCKIHLNNGTLAHITLNN
jgi:environmental stress-induced protein Ves